MFASCDWTDAVPVSPETRELWAWEAVRGCANGEPWAYTQSGDSIVIAFRVEGEGTIYVVDARVRRTVELPVLPLPPDEAPNADA